MTGCQAINNIFFPEICSSCEEINEGLLCEKCRNSIIEIKKISCHWCGAPFVSDIHEFPSNDKSSFLLSDELFQKSQNPKIDPKNQKICTPKKIHKYCPSCRDGGYSFHKLRSFGLYTGVLKKLIIKFKYSRIFTLAPVLNGFLKKVYIENYADEKIDYVDTVPNFLDFKGSLTLSMFYAQNHMKILAELFAMETGIP
ncbi:MAG: double zinc ribbon domain-containing protein, partial [Candidatus Humimicrobiaceae bacterium]